MIRGNSFTVKSTFSLLLFLTSLFCFSISYQEISRIKLNYDLGFQENINYFDKKAFQKYYEKIEIQNLTDPIFDEKKSKNYFRDISFSNLLSLFDDETLEESAPKVIDDNSKEEKIVDDVNDLIEEEKFSYQDSNVSKGDNFAKILKKGGLRGRDIDKLIINGGDVYDFSKIYQGDIIKIFSKYDDNKNLNNFELIYRFSKIEELFISFLEDKFIYEIKKIPVTSEKIFVSGVIETSLYKAMKDKGLSEIIINEIIRIYSFDVDFQRDIYAGDNFEIYFTREKNEKNETVSIKDPEYLMLSSRGTELPYYLYSTEEFNEYFDENGKGMTKSLMKTPINGARLSSSYGMRKHPILGYNKMHKGVDFAAPTGTPIFAAGNGIVEYVGRNGGYGKYIRIRHDGTYKTAYAHLNSYKKGIGNGVRVKQGDIIGYVGSTGRSTGPHLHYEIIVNGQQINPATLKLPSGRKLNEQQLIDFNLLVSQKNIEVEKLRGL
jgi:murein DD-endopeptidase MepM/ murein hydrolase activator NlpD